MAPKSLAACGVPDHDFWDSNTSPFGAGAFILENFLLPIPGKRYFTIGEVSDLCGVKPHVLRYWEQEFEQLRPMKRRGNRRYYQHHEVSIIRRIRELLYAQGFTIIGARQKLEGLAPTRAEKQIDSNARPENPDFHSPPAVGSSIPVCFDETPPELSDELTCAEAPHGLERVRRELLEIRDLLRLA